MSVLLVKNNSEIEYNSKESLEKQMGDLKKVIINYELADESISKFIQEIERFSKNGTVFNFTIEVKHNDILAGFRTKKTISKLKSDIMFNEIVKLMALTHQCADKKLQDLVNYCTGK